MNFFGKLILALGLMLMGSISLAALSLPRAVQCRSTLEGPVIKVQFSKITFTTPKFIAPEPSRDQGLGTYDDCTAPTNQVTMTIGDQVYQTTDAPAVVKTTGYCDTAAVNALNYLKLTFKNVDVPAYRATAQLWSSGLLTIEAGSIHTHYDCSISEAY